MYYFSFAFFAFCLIQLSFSRVRDRDYEFISERRNPRKEYSSGSNDNFCDINACQLLEILEKRSAELEKKVRSLDQPKWKITDDNLRWSQCAQGPCNCLPPSFTVNCWRLHLTSIPSHQTVPSETAYLDLGSNAITSLEKNTFHGLHDLIQLDLSDNEIEFLPEVLLEDLGNLKYLLLQRNKLENIEGGTFMFLKNLQTLDLSENKIKNLASNVWRGLQSLRTLNLARNELSTWRNFDTLANLEDLDLSNNKITELDDFTRLPKLKLLQLNHNQIKTLPPNAFMGLTSLKTLSLRQNDITELPAHIFMDLHSLETLDLSHNLLVSITPYTLSGLETTLKDLDLGRNMIDTIIDGTFKKFEVLNRLSLDGNNIENLEPMAFQGLKNVTWLILSNNIIQQLPKTIFDPLMNISKLELDGNQLRSIEENGLETIVDTLQAIKLGKNAWHCGCNARYITLWVRDYIRMIWDAQPTCSTPTHLSGKNLIDMTFRDLCDGQWQSMRNLPTRVN